MNAARGADNACACLDMNRRPRNREGDRENVRTNDDEFMERVLAVFGMEDGSGHGRERKGKERRKEKNK